ncbi:hypothetical protein [Nocardia sp. NPDC049149]|uniref:hypothetical protein n=1 Tax=Nocardia sp. NPDC049149 TaxID=3364315 RepID=UPI0037247082
MGSQRGQRTARRGKTSLGVTALALLFLLGAALLSACSSGESADADRNSPPDPATVDCTSGGQAVASLRETFRQLSEQLDGLGPAAQRGDIAEVKSRASQGMALSNQVAATINPVADKMDSKLIGGAYRDVAAAGGQLNTALADFNTAIDNNSPAQPVADAVSAALTSLNGSMERMKRACPVVFAEPKGPAYGPPLTAR